MTDTQKIFSLSKTYSGDYRGEELPVNKIQWPEGWLSKRRRELAQKENEDEK